jgi:hypothetical protein
MGFLKYRLPVSGQWGNSLSCAALNVSMICFAARK